jgi:hypothetical protein
MDNMGDMDFDLMIDDPNVRGQEEEEKEEGETEMADEQEVTSTDPPDQA